MFEVIAPGLEATIQDAGRPGLRHLGIPQSGAADRLSFALANQLLGNRWDAPAVEITLGGLSLQARSDARIAVSGADMMLTCAQRPVPAFKPFNIKAGEVIRFGYAASGARAYLAVEGGFEADIFAGSRAAYPPAKIGGIKGRALKAADQLKSAALPCQTPTALPVHIFPTFAKSMVLRVQKAPEFNSYLSADTQRRLFTEGFIAGAQTNRMGARLAPLNPQAKPLSLSNLTALTSSALLPGTLQITPNGTPIICAVDAHCTGGYARALSIITADHWLIGQIAPGTHIYFRRTRRDEAVSALTLRTKIYKEFIPEFSFDSKLSVENAQDG